MRFRSPGRRSRPGGNCYPFTALTQICAIWGLTIVRRVRIMQSNQTNQTDEQEEYLVRSPFREPWMVGSRQRTFQRMDLRGQSERAGASVAADGDRTRYQRGTDGFT